MHARIVLAGGTLLVSAALLGGCGDSGKDVALKNVSVEEAAKQAQAANQLQPGQWESGVQIVSAEVPGAPPEVSKALSQSVGSQSAKSSGCITPEEAAKPSARLFSGNKSADCRYDSFNMANGRMDAVMLCKPQAGQPGEMRMTMNGTYTATAYDFDMTMRMGAIPGMPADQAMIMKAKATGKRTGECTGAAS